MNKNLIYSESHVQRLRKRIKELEAKNKLLQEALEEIINDKQYGITVVAKNVVTRARQALWQNSNVREEEGIK
ncbi:MAG: hypothetical protein JSW62_02940 [Thermoplasmatales archaeon]|nr:MAG: hypothetical protein JSW62_02940 [Thermoplasmatales archaeon]